MIIPHCYDYLTFVVAVVDMKNLHLIAGHRRQQHLVYMSRLRILTSIKQVVFRTKLTCCL